MFTASVAARALPVMTAMLAITATNSATAPSRPILAPVHLIEIIPMPDVIVGAAIFWPRRYFTLNVAD